MTSVIKNYAQADNRVERVTLTGFISNNGSISGLITDQHPAYAAIDLTKSKNFTIDTRVLTLRTGTPSPTGYLLRIYMTSNKPPSYYPNFEFDIFITPPQNDERISIEIFADKENAENAQIIGAISRRLYSFTNEIPTSPGSYSDSTGVISFKVLNNSIILKGIPPSYSA
jgi:hypothetical protein